MNDCSGNGWCKYSGDLRWPVCECDLGFIGSDCSKRPCPWGTNFKVPDSYKYEIQKVRIYSTRQLPDITGYYLLKFQDLDGFVHSTRPIKYTSREEVTSVAAEESYLENMLLDIPTKVLNNVDVKLQSGSTDGLQYTILFRDWGGDIPLLQCDITHCDQKGCLPRTQGLFAHAHSGVSTVRCEVTTVQESDKILEVCAGNGICDYGTGLCHCFEGAMGNACELLDTLV